MERWLSAKSLLEDVVAAKELFSERYLTVAEANRRNYANVARHYVKYMAKIDSPELLAEDLRRALGRLGNLGRKPVALDACGGSGDTALMLQQLGCDVLLVDISPEMIGFYKEACAMAGFGAETECSEIGSFFTHTQRRFDLIVFRSALHHLEDHLLEHTGSSGVIIVVKHGQVGGPCDPLDKRLVVEASAGVEFREKADIGISDFELSPVLVLLAPSDHVS